jgi:F-type H+-transporting ATPase subunit gamma
MSETAAALRFKLDSAQELRSVVRTMKALAASSIGQYEKSVVALGDYYRTVELGLGASFRAAAETPSPSDKRQPPPGAFRAVVFGSDLGLVGSFNDTVVEEALKAFAATSRPVHIWTVGERVHARLEEAARPVTAQFAVPISVEAIAPFVGELLVTTEGDNAWQEGSELTLFYNRPARGAGYSPTHQRLLPLDEPWRRSLLAVGWPEKRLPEVLGDGNVTLRALVREYLFISIFRACAESLASENASRLAAMQRAEKNIDQLLKDLQSAFHRVRQAGIDEELFDVVAAYEGRSRPKHRQVG